MSSVSSGSVSHEEGVDDGCRHHPAEFLARDQVAVQEGA
jgi:hypothetical protein